MPEAWRNFLLSVIFVCLYLIFRTFYGYKIFKYVEKNYPKVFYKYNANNLSYWIHGVSTRMNFDLLLSKKLNLDKSLDKYILIYRIIAVAFLIVLAIWIYVVYF